MNRLASIKTAGIVVFFVAAGIATSPSTFPSPNNSASKSLTRKSSEGKSATGLSSLPADAQGAISAALGKDDSSYWIRPNADGFRGENPRHALVAEFTRQGAEVRSHNLRWTLETRAYGYGDAVRRVKAVTPQATANRLEYRRNGVTEWYENGPLGLEQGFTVAHRPGKANWQALTLELGLSGDLTAVLEPGGKALELRRKDGDVALRYTGLEARDATGQELRSWLEVRGKRLLVRVDDSGARYPLVVDPWVEQAELTASDAGLLGSSVAVSGSTIIVGDPGAHQVGSAHVFVESGGTWSQLAELRASDGVTNDEFGDSVAISGSTVVVGAPNHGGGSNAFQGAAYVFLESGGRWSQQAELTASNGVQCDHFGNSVAVNGSTVVVGAPSHPGTCDLTNGPGAAYVFVESVGAWSEQAELTASDGHPEYMFGASVAVSGSTVLVGAPNHIVGSHDFQGSAYVFVESGGTWSQQTELTSSDGEGSDSFGESVALSGSTVVVGALGHNAAQGAAYVFVESGGTWSQQAELTASDGAADDRFGWSVAVTGSTVAVGAPTHAIVSNSQQGSAYVFVESGGTWSQQPELTASDSAGGDFFGDSVAVDGSTVVVGAPQHTVGSNALQGAAYVFAPGPNQPAVTLGPAPLNFGNVAVNSSSSPQAVTLKNTGTATMVINKITASANFAISSNNCGSTLAATRTCTVSVTFIPTRLVAVTGRLRFADNAFGSPQTVALSGTGVVQAALTPVSTAYAEQAVSTTSPPKTFALTNNLSVALTSIVISTSGDFAVSAATCGTSLAAKSACTISVTFTPTATGTRTGKLIVSDSASSSPQTSSLTGTGVAVTLTPASASYAQQAVGTTSAPQTFTLANGQTVALTSIVISTRGDFAVSATTCGTSLAPKSTCTISVTFTPTATGTRAGKLIVRDSASDSSQTSSLSGLGIVPATLTPASATYAPQTVGTTSPPKTFTLTNDQSVLLTSIAISITGDFAVSAKTCGTSLAAKSRCTVSVTFTPTATGTRTGQLRVSDGASDSPQISNLMGTGK